MTRPSSVMGPVSLLPFVNVSRRDSHVRMRATIKRQVEGLMPKNSGRYVDHETYAAFRGSPHFEYLRGTAEKRRGLMRFRVSEKAELGSKTSPTCFHEESDMHSRIC